MPLPARIKHKSGRENAGKRCPAHRAWVRGFACSACGSTVAIECAHIRNGTGGGLGVKPSDRWCVSLCKDCHGLQHTVGEKSFWQLNGKDPLALAEAFARKSPHWPKLREMA